MFRGYWMLIRKLCKYLCAPANITCTEDTVAISQRFHVVKDGKCEKFNLENPHLGTNLSPILPAPRDKMICTEILGIIQKAHPDKVSGWGGGGTPEEGGLSLMQSKIWDVANQKGIHPTIVFVRNITSNGSWCSRFAIFTPKKRTVHMQEIQIPQPQLTQ